MGVSPLISGKRRRRRQCALRDRKRKGDMSSLSPSSSSMHRSVLRWLHEIRYSAEPYENLPGKSRTRQETVEGGCREMSGVIGRGAEGMNEVIMYVEVAETDDVVYEDARSSPETYDCGMEVTEATGNNRKAIRNDLDTSEAIYVNLRESPEINDVMYEDARSTPDIYEVTETIEITENRTETNEPIYVNLPETNEPKHEHTRNNSLILPETTETNRTPSQNNIGTSEPIYVNLSDRTRTEHTRSTAETDEPIYVNLRDSPETNEESFERRIKYARVCTVSCVFDELPVQFGCDRSGVGMMVWPLFLTGDVRLWWEELRYECSTEEEEEEVDGVVEDVLRSLEGIPEVATPRTSPFPVDDAVAELRRRTERIPRHSATIHFIPTNAKPKTHVKDVYSNCYEKVLKVTFNGVTKKLSKGHVLKVESGKMYIADEKGNILETIKDNIRIINQKLVNKKEVELTDHHRNTYHLHFDNSKDAKLNAPPQTTPTTTTTTVHRSNSVSANEKTTIKNRLLRLLGKRSSRDLLERKGIIKPEPIFGNTVANLKEKYGTTVPEFVSKVIELVELPKNVVSQGLYRASGNLATIQRVRFEIDRGNIGILEEYMDEVDVLTGALKLFFRELGEPLLPRGAYEALVKRQGPGPEVVRIINGVGKTHREVFLTVIDHLLRVEKYKGENKMDVHNLSVVWGPSLLWLPDFFQGENLLKSSANAVRVIEMVLNTYKEFGRSPNESKRAPTTKRSLGLFGGSPKGSEPLFLDWKGADGGSKIERSDALTASAESLTDTPKGGIFGNSLQNLCANSKQTIPEFVQRATSMIELNADCIGVYRQSGDKTKIDRIKRKVAKNRYGSLEKFKDDTHELACALKQFFNELATHLITEEIVRTFIEEGEESLLAALNNLPITHRDTLAHLLRHLWRIIDNPDNRMTKNALAIVWAPTLCRITSNERGEVDTCARLIERLLDLHEPRRGADGRGEPSNRAESRSGKGKSVYDNVRGEASILDCDRLTKL